MVKRSVVSIPDTPRRALRVGGLLAALSCVLGCNAGDAPAYVTGVVTLDGEPVTAGSIKAVRDDGVAVSGAIESTGAFELGSRGESGIPSGEYRVSVFAHAPGGQNGGPESPPKLLAPLRYTHPDRSGLSFVVASGERVAVSLEMQSK